MRAAQAPASSPHMRHTVQEGIVRVFLYYIGRPRDPHAHALAEEYVRRSRRFVPCYILEWEDLRHPPWERHKRAIKVALSPQGQLRDTAGFLQLFEEANRMAKDLVFLIGGAEGLPPQWVMEADLQLSLTPLTLPHELARVILAEQIYRAVTTLHGHPYPR